MLDLMLAAALLQAAEPCHAAARPPTPAVCPAWRAVHRDERAPQPAPPNSPNGALLAEFCPRRGE